MKIEALSEKLPKDCENWLANIYQLLPVFLSRIRIRRIQKFFGPPGSGSVIICAGPDPAPDPSINKQKMEKNLAFYSFLTS